MISGPSSVPRAVLSVLSPVISVGTCALPWELVLFGQSIGPGENFKTFKYTEYPDGGHGIPGRVFDDETVHDWLFAQALKK